MEDLDAMAKERKEIFIKEAFNSQKQLGVNSAPCTHPRHPIIQSNGSLAAFKYTAPVFPCPVCTVRRLIHTLVFSQKMWASNGLKMRQSYFISKKNLENEIINLEEVAKMEKNWDMWYWYYSDSLWCGATDALSMVEMFSHHRYKYAWQVRSEDGKNLTVTFAAPPEAESTPDPVNKKPKKNLVVRFDEPVVEHPKRPQLQFKRGNKDLYQPGRYACPDECGWQDTSWYTFNPNFYYLWASQQDNAAESDPAEKAPSDMDATSLSTIATEGRCCGET